MGAVTKDISATQNDGTSKETGEAGRSVGSGRVRISDLGDDEIKKGDTVLPRVLVIDDEQLLGQTIQLGLEDTMQVELETSGAQGLARILSDEDFELVLCDLSLPDLSGIEIYARVARERPELTRRFVIMTGGAVSLESRDFLDNYQGPLLNKPFTLSQVETLVNEMLDD